MRGKVSLDNLYIIIPGITPAYAGKRELNGKRKQSLKDHPRLCGEKRKIVDHTPI